MKQYDLTEGLTDFVIDNELKDGQEILSELDGRRICKAVVCRTDEDIDFKVKMT